MHVAAVGERHQAHGVSGQQRADLGRQQVAGRDAVCGGHTPERHRGGKVRVLRKRQRGDVFW